TTRGDCRAPVAGDPRADLRRVGARSGGVIYLDGNSLGARPRAAVDRAAEVVAAEWGEGLSRSWNSADRRGLPERLGDKLAPLI
ncbi:kynureninase, partial [Pseudomonas aeruginosa]